MTPFYLLFLLPLLHLLAAPYTKVEESFALQAAHDILVYGIPTSSPAARLAAVYDHASFPGAVQRSFVGTVLLAGLSQPLCGLVGFRHAQLLVRAVLGAVNAAGLLVFGRALEDACGKGVARWWVVLLVSQFHVVFYASRTLPNMFAFGMTTLAFAFLLPKKDPHKAAVHRRQAIALLVLSAVVFRAEIAILLAATTLHLLLTKQTTLTSLIPLLLGTFLAALALSVPLDSYFWQKPIWPELWTFYYNVVLGSASNWGVSPWHYYFSLALPRLLLNPLAFPLICLALLHPATARLARGLSVPSLLYVAIYSFQPHKETRFIIYIIPPLTAAAALGANYIATRRAKSLYRLSTYILALSVLATFGASTAMLILSTLNYPGGDALTHLFTLICRDGSAPTVKVHADVLTCMTGLTRFGQNPAGLPLALDRSVWPAEHASTPIVLFDKTEDAAQLKQLRFWEGMDYALMEDPSVALGDWESVGLVDGFDGLEFLTPGEGKDAHGAEARGPAALGLGARVAKARDAVRQLTGGWWIGPRMAPRIHIMKRSHANPAVATA